MAVSEHASKQYDLDLDSIRSRVLQMGGLVESQIRRAIEALNSGDRALIEFGVTDELFIKPTKKQTEDYITGRFG